VHRETPGRRLRKRRDAMKMRVLGVLALMLCLMPITAAAEIRTSSDDLQDYLYEGGKVTVNTRGLAEWASGAAPCTTIESVSGETGTPIQWVFCTSRSAIDVTQTVAGHTIVYSLPLSRYTQNITTSVNGLSVDMTDPYFDDAISTNGCLGCGFGIFGMLIGTSTTLMATCNPVVAGASAAASCVGGIGLVLAGWGGVADECIECDEGGGGSPGTPGPGTPEPGGCGNGYHACCTNACCSNGNPPSCCNPPCGVLP